MSLFSPQVQMYLLLLCLSAILGSGFADPVRRHCESCCDNEKSLTAEESDALTCKSISDKLQSITGTMKMAMCTGIFLLSFIVSCLS